MISIPLIPQQMYASISDDIDDSDDTDDADEAMEQQQQQQEEEVEVEVEVDSDDEPLSNTVKIHNGTSTMMQPSILKISDTIILANEVSVAWW